MEKQKSNDSEALLLSGKKTHRNPRNPKGLQKESKDWSTQNPQGKKRAIYNDLFGRRLGIPPNGGDLVREVSPKKALN